MQASLWVCTAFGKGVFGQTLLMCLCWNLVWGGGGVLSWSKPGICGVRKVTHMTICRAPHFFRSWGQEIKVDLTLFSCFRAFLNFEIMWCLSRKLSLGSPGDWQFMKNDTFSAMPEIAVPTMNQIALLALFMESNFRNWLRPGLDVFFLFFCPQMILWFSKLASLFGCGLGICMYVLFIELRISVLLLLLYRSFNVFLSVEIRDSHSTLFLRVSLMRWVYVYGMNGKKSEKLFFVFFVLLICHPVCIYPPTDPPQPFYRICEQSWHVNVSLGERICLGWRIYI